MLRAEPGKGKGMRMGARADPFANVAALLGPVDDVEAPPPKPKEEDSPPAGGDPSAAATAPAGVDGGAAPQGREGDATKAAGAVAAFEGNRAAANAWGGALAGVGAAPPKSKATIVVGDERTSKWAHIRQELADVGIGGAEGGSRGGGLSEAQKEILSMGKEEWVRKVERSRINRKMSGVVAITMALAVTYYAADIFVVVDDSRGENLPSLVRLLVFCTVVWSLLTLAFLLRQCLASAKNDMMLDTAKRALEDRDERKRRRETERRESRREARRSRNSFDDA